MMFDLFVLFAAGFAGGMLNSIAGGGTFITFPALLFAGLPPISANATNTFASCSGYLSGMYAYRHDLLEHRQELPKFVIVSLVGGVVGAWLLLQTPQTVFREIIPWLLMFATLLFVYGERLNVFFKSLAERHRHAGVLGGVLAGLLLLAVCVYGGFFNAGLGIVSLSYLALAGYTNIHAMNGLKLLVSSCVSLIAIALFIFNGTIAWDAGTAVLLGSLVGGYISARVSRRIDPRLVRACVIALGTLITAYFFLDVYAKV